MDQTNRIALDGAAIQEMREANETRAAPFLQYTSAKTAGVLATGKRRSRKGGFPFEQDAPLMQGDGHAKCACARAHPMHASMAT